MFTYFRSGFKKFQNFLKNLLTRSHFFDFATHIFKKFSKNITALLPIFSSLASANIR